MKVKCINLNPLQIKGRIITYNVESEILTLSKEYDVISETTDIIKSAYTGKPDGNTYDCYVIIADNGIKISCLKERFEIVKEKILGQRKSKSHV